MASNEQEKSAPDGAAFDDFFESIGKKAENLTSKDGKVEAQPNTNGTTTEDDADEQKVVDEIESLCMNCHENVRII
jgi:zinc finger protein